MHVEMDLWRGVHLESRGRMRQERDAGVVRERDVGERRRRVRRESEAVELTSVLIEEEPSEHIQDVGAVYLISLTHGNVGHY